MQLLNSGVDYSLFSHLCLIYLSHGGRKDYLIAFQGAWLLYDQARNQQALTLMQRIPEVTRFFTPYAARQWKESGVSMLVSIILLIRKLLQVPIYCKYTSLPMNENTFWELLFQLP